MVSLQAHIIFRVRGDKVKEFVEQYTTIGEGPNQVQVAFGNYLKEPLRTRIREAAAQYDAFALNEKIGQISDELTPWAQEKTKDTPFEVMNVVVGNLQYPAVVAQAVANKLAVSQDLETRSTQVEIARKDAERRVVEAEGIAKATQIIQQRLTPLYVQHEAIEAQKAMVGSPNHSVIYIPVGPMGVPLVSTLPAPVESKCTRPRLLLQQRQQSADPPACDPGHVARPHPGGLDRRRPMATPVYMLTLGCPKNRVDTEVMLGALAAARATALVAGAAGRRRHRRQHLRLHRERQARSRSTPSSSWREYKKDGTLRDAGRDRLPGAALRERAGPGDARGRSLPRHRRLRADRRPARAERAGRAQVDRPPTPTTSTTRVDPQRELAARATPRT